MPNDHAVNEKNESALRCLGTLLRKDLLVICRSRGVGTNFLLPTLVVSVVLPCLVFGTSGALLGAPGTAGQWIGTLMDRLPRSVLQEIASLSEVQRICYVVAVYYFAPFFLLQAASITIALSGTAVVGEKHGNTLETLLMCPISDLELLLSKIICCSAPGTLVTCVTFIVYCVVVNILTHPVMHGTWFPVPLWFLLVLVVVPLVSLLVASLTLAFSLKLKHPGDATQLGNLILVPLIALFFSQVLGWAHFDMRLLATAAIVLVVLNVVLFGAALKVFNRKRLAESGV